MPWCPKCETEYVEGMAVCADCGSVLVENLPDKKKKEEYEHSFPTVEELDEETAMAMLEAGRKEARERMKQLAEGPSVYVESSKKAEEFKSGGLVLLVAGAIGFLAVVLVFTGIIPWEMNLFSKYFILGVMGTMFFLFAIMGILSLKSYKKFELKASEENTLTNNLNNWCRENLTKDLIDEAMEEEEEELKYFRRTERIKELIGQKFMNLDAAFLDSFVDDLYQEMFGE